MQNLLQFFNIVFKKKGLILKTYISNISRASPILHPIASMVFINH